MAQSERVVTVDHDAGATADCGAVLLLAGARHRRCPASRVEVARLASPFPYHALGEEHAFFSLMVSLNASLGRRSLGAEGLTWPFPRGRRDFPSRRPEARVSGREREKMRTEPSASHGSTRERWYSASMDRNLFRYIWTHSKRDQIIIFLVVLASLPFYFASLDLPRKIVNEAIQGKAFEKGRETAPFLELSFNLPEWTGGSRIHLFEGFSVGRLELLFGLSVLFLFFVLVNGWFKYY